MIFWAKFVKIETQSSLCEKKRFVIRENELQLLFTQSMWKIKIIISKTKLIEF